MGLTNCPDCKNVVSDAAVTCPHCGRPLAPLPSAGTHGSKRVPGWSVAVAAIATLLSMGVCLDRSESPSDSDRQNGPVAGLGNSVADSVYANVKPQVAETIFTPDSDSPRKYLMDRLNDARDDRPSWRFPQPVFARSASGPMASMTISFSDGSSLVFFDSPNPGSGTGLRLDSVVIHR